MISYSISFLSLAQKYLIRFYNFPEICRNSILDYKNVPKEVITGLQFCISPWFCQSCDGSYYLINKFINWPQKIKVEFVNHNIFYWSSLNIPDLIYNKLRTNNIPFHFNIIATATKKKSGITRAQTYIY